jgi:superfamily II DNA or RNA helicase
MLCKLRPYQENAIREKDIYKKCLVNIWCGLGKTMTFTVSIIMDDRELVVIVFPSIGLINQFNRDYILNGPLMDYWDNYIFMSFCSESENAIDGNNMIEYTTDVKRLKKFLKGSKQKFLTVTYQSFEKFSQTIKSNKITIDKIIYDEAHNAVGEQIQELVFHDKEFESHITKIEFWTATPVNRNGIKMIASGDDEESDCGALAFEYLYWEGVRDGWCRRYQVCLSLSVMNNDSKYGYVYEHIIHHCLSGEYDYWNVLTFHGLVNETDSANSSMVNEFVSKKNIRLFLKLFVDIQRKDYPKTRKKFKVSDIVFKGIGSKTKNRDKIVADFDKKKRGRIYILSSCRTIGEGIDTKWANMEVMVDPTGSVVQESQKIGRVTRKPEKDMPDSVIVIPVSVDKKKYSGAKTKEERDELLRIELNENRDYNTFVNVMAAMKYQHDREMYEMCIKYPNMFSPDEVKGNLKKQCCDIVDMKGSALDSIQYLADNTDLLKDDDVSEGYDCHVGKTDEKTLRNISNITNRPIHVHTQDFDKPIITYNRKGKNDKIVLFKDENGKYSPVKPKKKNKKIRNLSKPSRKKRDKMFKVHMSNEFKLLWDIKDDSIIDLENGFSKGVLDCTMSWDEKNEERWFKYLNKCMDFITTNGFRPSKRSIDKEESFLGSWLVTQGKNYRNNTNTMENNKIKIAWENFTSNPLFEKYFMSNDDKWNVVFKECIKYIEKKERLPSSVGKSEKEIFLGRWIVNQKQKYKKDMLTDGQTKIWKNYFDVFQ